MPFYTLDDFSRERLSGFTDLDSFSHQRKSFLSLDEFSANRMGLDYKTFKDLGRYRQEEEDHSNLLKILEQMGRGAASEATLGFSKKLLGDEQPAGPSEQVARGVGQFIGFLAPLGLVSKGVRAGKTALGLGKLIQGSKYAKELAVASRIGESALTLGGASAISDIPALVENPEEAAKRAGESAMVGGIFGAAGFAHVKDNPVLSWMLRQFGGRAAMLVTGIYGKETLDKKNLAQTVFSEAMNTMFLSKGITPEMVMRGEFKTTDQKAMYEAADAATIRVNEFSAANEKLRVPIKMFRMPKVTKELVANIRSSVPESELNQEAVGSYKNNIKRGILRPMNLRWNKDADGYEVINQNEYLQALKEANLELLAEGKKPYENVTVNLLTTRGGEAPKLPRPIQWASDFIGKKIDADTIKKIDSSRYYMYDLDTRSLIPIDYSNYSHHRNIPVSDREILFEIGSFSDSQNKWSLVPIRKGKGVPKFQYEGQKVFSKRQDDAQLDYLYSIMNHIKDQYPQLREGDWNGVPNQIAVEYQNAQLNAGNIHSKYARLDEIDNARVMKEMESGKVMLHKSYETLGQGFTLSTKIGDIVRDPARKTLGDWKVKSIQFDPAGKQDGLVTVRNLKSGKIEELSVLSNWQGVTIKRTSVPSKAPKWRGIDKAVEDAERKLKLIRNIPDMRLPISYLGKLDARATNLKIGIDLQKLNKALYVNGPWQIKHLPMLETWLLNAEKLPIEKRMTYYADGLTTKHDLYKTNITGELGVRQNTADAINERYRKDLYAKASYNANNVEGSGTVMRQLLTTTRLRMWQDANKFFAHMQVRTGLPFFSIYKKISTGIENKKFELQARTKVLNKFAQMPAEEQVGVYEYYNTRFAMLDTKPIIAKLNPTQLDYIKTVDQLFTDLAPFVVEERHQRWMENFYYPEQRGEKLPSSHKIYRNQEDSKVSDFLKLGAKFYDEFIITRDRAKYDQWVQDAMDMGLGVIAEKSYMPEFIMKVGDPKLDKSYELTHIGAFGEGHLKSRGKVKEKIGEIDLADSLASMFRDRNLHTRIYAYVNQLMNLKHVEPGIRALEDLVRLFPEDFNQAKPPGLGRVGVEAKGMSLMDYMKYYAHRAKGYPIKTGPLGEWSRMVQSTFFRALTPRPYLWLRNFPQMVVTNPMKTSIMDPRYWFRKEYSFKSLPPRAANFFAVRVSQLGAFRQDFLQLMESEKLKNIPFVKTFVDVAEKVGNVYSLTDELNRRLVFSKTFYKTRDTVNAYLKGQINVSQMEGKIGILKMETENQRIFRQMVDAKDAEGAAIHTAEWADINTNWNYRRTEKSLAEMTGEGESWTNLLTWSKSVTQQVIDSMTGIKDGFDMMKHGGAEASMGRQKMMQGAGATIGLMLTGYLANFMLSTISVTPGAKYQAYGTGMFTWELGGVSFQIIQDFSEALSGVVESVDGTPQDRQTALDALLKQVDNVAIRQLLPFAKNALAVVESVTGRSYISPFYEKVHGMLGKSTGETYVQRTWMEGIAHAVLATDPNKSKDVREYTFKQMLELDRKRMEPGPFQSVIEGMYQLYKYYNDVFMRYEPYQALKMREKEEYEKSYQKALEDEQSDYLMQRQRQQYRMQRDNGRR